MESEGREVEDLSARARERARCGGKRATDRERKKERE